MEAAFERDNRIQAELPLGFSSQEQDGDVEIAVSETNGADIAQTDLGLGNTDEHGQENDEVVVDPSTWERVRGFVGRHKGKLAMGVLAASAALTFANNPLSELKEEVVDAFPIVATGVVVSETAFVAGAAMMAASVGSKVGNPLTLKDRLPEIATHANDSLLFKAGLWTNTAGAVGSAAVFSVGIMQMPVETYPALAATVADLGLTVAVRKAMIAGIRNNRIPNTETSPDQAA
jgi:hypothetical protein